MVVAFAARRVKKRPSCTVIKQAITLILMAGTVFHPLFTAAESPSLLGPAAAKHARVVIVQDSEAISTFDPQPDKIDEMVRRGLTNLTGQDTATAALRSLMSTQEVVGLKVFCAPGKMIGTRPEVVAAVIKSLIAAGFPAKNLIVWDKYLNDLQRAGFARLAERYGVGIAGSADEGYDENAYYSTSLIGKLVWGDHEFGRKGDDLGRKSFVSKLVTKKMTKIINITPLLNHNLAGVSGNLFGLSFGSVDNCLRFESAPQYLATAIPEIYALPQLGDRVVLNIVDALICQYQGEDTMHLHYTTTLGQLRFSTDPVALDVLSMEELNHQRQLNKIPPVAPSSQIYTNATLLEIGINDPRKIDLIHLP